MTLEDLHDCETEALAYMRLADHHKSIVRQCVALGRLDRYHGMIEAMGRAYSPDLWNAINPLDKRK